jgi:hypothetical protein
MSKRIQISKAPGKEEFVYKCQICKVHRRVDWYESTPETKKKVAEDKRFFLGPMCETCLDVSKEYEVKGVTDGDDGEKS